MILISDLHPDLHLKRVPQLQAALFQKALAHQAGVGQPL